MAPNDYTSVDGAGAVKIVAENMPQNHILLVRVDTIVKRQVGEKAVLNLAGITCDGLAFEATSFEKTITGPPSTSDPYLVRH